MPVRRLLPTASRTQPAAKGGAASVADGEHAAGVAWQRLRSGHGGLQWLAVRPAVAGRCACPFQAGLSGCDDEFRFGLAQLVVSGAPCTAQRPAVANRLCGRGGSTVLSTQAESVRDGAGTGVKSTKCGVWRGAAHTPSGTWTVCQCHGCRALWRKLVVGVRGQPAGVPTGRSDRRCGGRTWTDPAWRRLPVVLQPRLAPSRLGDIEHGRLRQC